MLDKKELPILNSAAPFVLMNIVYIVVRKTTAGH